MPTAMVAGSVYNVNVTLSNTGTTTWTTAASYALGPENNPTWGIGRGALPSSISPGGQASINFQVTAPSTPGTYQWRMLQENVEWFGPYTPNVAVTVSAYSGKSRPVILVQNQPSILLK